MTNNPLIAKWEELHNPKKEPPKKVEGEKTIADELKFQGTITIPITKPNNFIPTTNASVSFIPKPYTRHDSTIATLEALLEDLKSGRAIMTDLKTQPNWDHLASIPFDLDYPLIDRGDKITLEIFRKYG
jgi:hypothetical protein